MSLKEIVMLVLDICSFGTLIILFVYSIFRLFSD